MSAEYLTLLLADARLPTGAHTKSAGVEPALGHGMRLDQVPDYLTVRLRTVTETEAATAVLAREVWLATAPDGRRSALEAVDRAWRVRTVSDALRDASDQLGRGYLRMAATVWDLGALTASPSRVWCRPVVVGAVAALAGVPAAGTARLVAFDDVQTVIAAALKLVPFDPSQGVRWSAAAAAEVEDLVTRVQHISSIDELPARSAPLVEQWAQLHRSTERRLFRA